MMYLKLYGDFHDEIVRGPGPDPDSKWWKFMLALLPGVVIAFLSGCMNPMMELDIEDISEDEFASDVVDAIGDATFTIEDESRIEVNLNGAQSGVMFYLTKLKQTYPQIPGDISSIQISELNMPGRFMISVFDKDYNYNDPEEVRNKHQRVYYFESGYNALSSGAIDISFVNEVIVETWNNYSNSVGVTVVPRNNDGDAQGIEETFEVTFPAGDDRSVTVDLTGRSSAKTEEENDIMTYPDSTDQIGIVDLNTDITGALVLIADATAADEYRAAKHENRALKMDIINAHVFQTTVDLVAGDNYFDLDDLPLSTNIWLDGAATIFDFGATQIVYDLPGSGENFIAYPLSGSSDSVSITSKEDSILFSYVSPYEDQVTVVMVDKNGNSISHSGLDNGMVSLKDFYEFVGVSTLAGNTPTGTFYQDGSEQRAVIELANSEQAFFKFRDADGDMYGPISSYSDNINFTIHRSGTQDLEDILKKTGITFLAGNRTEISCSSLYDLVADADKPLLAGMDSYDFSTTLFEISSKSDELVFINGSYNMDLLEFTNKSGSTVECKISQISVNGGDDFELFNFDWSAVKAAGVYYNGNNSISNFKLGKIFYLQSGEASFEATAQGADFDPSTASLISIAASPENEINFSFSVDRGDGELVDAVVRPSDTFEMGDPVGLIILNLDGGSITDTWKFEIPGTGRLF